MTRMRVGLCAAVVAVLVSVAVASVDTSFVETEATAAAAAYDPSRIYIKGTLSSSYAQLKDLQVKTKKNGYAIVNTGAISKGLWKSKNLQAHNVTTTYLSTRVLAPADPSGELYFLGRFQINGRVVYGKTDKRLVLPPLGAEPETTTAFLETSISVMAESGGDDGEDTFHKQWSLVEHDDFAESIGTLGWEFSDGTSAEGQVMKCQAYNLFLASKQLAGTGTLRSLGKTFTDLPEHLQLEVTARVHFIDSWRGGSAFLKIDGEIVWIDSHGDPSDSIDDQGALDLCGSDFPNDKLSVPVTVIVPHGESSVTIEFGATLPADAATYPYQAILGVDDVSIFIQ